MKMTWRWPLAGFLLGGLVGATFLTVNVVGASRPNAPAASAGSFGEILHTPPLLARAGKAVELSFGVASDGSIALGVDGELKDEVTHTMRLTIARPSA